MNDFYKRTCQAATECGQIVIQPLTPPMPLLCGSRAMPDSTKIGSFAV